MLKLLKILACIGLVLIGMGLMGAGISNGFSWAGTLVLFGIWVIIAGVAGISSISGTFDA